MQYRVPLAIRVVGVGLAGARYVDAFDGSVSLNASINVTAGAIGGAGHLWSSSCYRKRNGALESSSVTQYPVDLLLQLAG